MPSQIYTPDEIRCKLIGNIQTRKFEHHCSFDGFDGDVKGVVIPDAKWVGWDSNTHEWIMKLKGSSCQITDKNLLLCGIGDALVETRKFAEDTEQTSGVRYAPRKMRTSAIYCNPVLESTLAHRRMQDEFARPMRCAVYPLGETTTQKVKGRVKRGRPTEIVRAKADVHVYPEHIAIRTVRRRDRSIGAEVNMYKGDVSINFIDESRTRLVKAPLHTGKHPAHKIPKEQDVYKVAVPNTVSYTTCAYRVSDNLLVCAAIEKELGCLQCEHLLSKHDESGMCEVKDCPCGIRDIHYDKLFIQRAIEAEQARQAAEADEKAKQAEGKKSISASDRSYAWTSLRSRTTTDYGPELYRKRRENE